MEDSRVLEEYLKSGRKLRQKYEEIKMGRQKRYTEQEEKYKPILSSMQSYGDSQAEILKEINSKMSSPSSDDTVGELALEYLIKPQGQVDKLYGIYRDNDGIYIGNKRIFITNNDIYLESNTTMYKGTQGL